MNRVVSAVLAPDVIRVSSVVLGVVAAAVSAFEW